ncbi:exodeoxyribonuclease V subunit alpha [Parashewanella curva]|uniref:RecBCD enzyme subunit RecD n=1 Tax=Parashewanella curva TaxID=2338552 RepID=A0A3L8PU94_9GAMM|nr:exodeoxyribonuclease V subunit alpha [Parashewanella curva]RLV58987.1 exodeoxyribonuclease V subunit alpha [Parashewanella curva]
MIYNNKPMPELLKYWELQGLLTPLDRHFAIEMAKMHQCGEPLYLFICAYLSKQLSNQHGCVVLEQINQANPMFESPRLCSLNFEIEDFKAALLSFPGISQYQEGQPCATPIILDGNRLYLQKYHQFELTVASTLNRLASNPIEVDIPNLTKQLSLVFPQPQNQDIDWQKIAAATALTRQLAVITGGPGTGKTTTVTKMLFLLQLNQELNIKLVAPTGKAAARLTESIKASKARLASDLEQHKDQIDLNAIDKIPEEASTIHRLLGVVPNSHRYRHNKDNPLRLDLLIVDEASMVDLPMMDKLLSALPENARLILLGDQDQLASVEAGAVLADICHGIKLKGQSGNSWKMRYSQNQLQTLSSLTNTDLSEFLDTNGHFGDSLCMLQYSHRFAGEAGIGQLAKAVNNGDIGNVLNVWQQGYDEISWLGHGEISANLQQNIGLVTLLNQSEKHYRPYLQLIKNLQESYKSGINKGDEAAIEVINKFNDYRLLCPMRSGDYGVDGINQQMADLLNKHHHINVNQEFYLGRPIIIQSNDYNLGLFNGDIGIVLQDSEQPDRLMAHFIKADGSILKVLPARLPTHETCYAMTVHKSQGSEFDRVAMVMPPQPTQSQWQLLTKELLYTAITRAKSHFVCLGSRNTFEHCVNHATERASGLADRLWKMT